MLENLIIFSCIAYVLYVVYCLTEEVEQEVIKIIHSNYAMHKRELIIGDDYE